MRHALELRVTPADAGLMMQPRVDVLGSCMSVHAAHVEPPPTHTNADPDWCANVRPSFLPCDPP